MQPDLQIGLIGSYGGNPLDILLPIISEDDFKRRTETCGHCFHIYNLDYTKLLIFCKCPDGQRRTAQIDIRSSCKVNSDISIYIVKTNNGKYYLRSYIDSNYNGLFLIPNSLTIQ